MKRVVHENTSVDHIKWEYKKYGTLVSREYELFDDDASKLIQFFTKHGFTDTLDDGVHVLTKGLDTFAVTDNYLNVLDA